MVLVATQVKRRRGTTAENDAFTGAEGEITVDTEKHELRVHDGMTQGGFKIGGGYHPNLFDHKWADHQLNDVSWLRADTFSWQSGDVYTAAYEHLLNDIGGKTLQSETISDTTIQFYLADDGHKICPASEESNVSAIYNSTGVAWYYVLDTTNKQFKLPRTKWGFTGIRSGVGKYIPESLPNITGQISSDRFGVYSSRSSSGVFSVTDGGIYGAASNTAEHHMKVSFSAHKSNTTYQDGAPVQERATEMYLYFYVGNFTQTALENTAGLNAEMFNGKVDLNFANVSATGKSTAVGWGMPDYSAGVALSNLDTYQKFNEDGFLCFEGSGGGNWNTVGIFVSLDGSTEAFQFRIASAYGVVNILAIPKGVYIKRSSSYTTSMKFFPCKK